MCCAFERTNSGDALQWDSVLYELRDFLVVYATLNCALLFHEAESFLESDKSNEQGPIIKEWGGCGEIYSSRVKRYTFQMTQTMEGDDEQCSL